MTSNWRTKESLITCEAMEVTSEVPNAHNPRPSIANSLFLPTSALRFQLRKVRPFCPGSAAPHRAFLSGQFLPGATECACSRVPASSLGYAMAGFRIPHPSEWRPLARTRTGMLKNCARVTLRCAADQTSGLLEVRSSPMKKESTDAILAYLQGKDASVG